MGIFITHAIACYVAIDIIWREYLFKRLKDNPKKLLWEYVLRTSIVFITCEFINENLFKNNIQKSSNELINAFDKQRFHSYNGRTYSKVRTIHFTGW